MIYVRDLITVQNSTTWQHFIQQPKCGSADDLVCPDVDDWVPERVGSGDDVYDYLKPLRRLYAFTQYWLTDVLKDEWSPGQVERPDDNNECAQRLAVLTWHQYGFVGHHTLQVASLLLRDHPDPGVGDGDRDACRYEYHDHIHNPLGRVCRHMEITRQLKVNGIEEFILLSSCK